MIVRACFELGYEAPSLGRVATKEYRRSKRPDERLERSIETVRSFGKQVQYSGRTAGLWQPCIGASHHPAYTDHRFGHQIVAHLQPGAAGDRATSTVDCPGVPIPHFGLVMEMPDWKKLAERLRSAGVTFMIEPYVRFAGLPGEQATMFLRDPSGNALEFKAFRDMSQIFVK